jgi:hypothetical protein
VTSGKSPRPGVQGQERGSVRVPPERRWSRPGGVTIAFIAFLYIATVNHRWQNADDSKWKRWKLAGEANLIGYGCVVFYMLWVKGLQ